jgi:hypothetical protein
VRKYKAELKAVRNEQLLPRIELGILQTLHSEQTPLRALVGKRGKILEDRGLVDREWDDEQWRVYELTPTAETTYFSESAKKTLALEAAPDDADQED